MQLLVVAALALVPRSSCVRKDESAPLATSGDPATAPATRGPGAVPSASPTFAPTASPTVAASAREATPPPPSTGVSTDTKAYCKKMYSRAYMLCRRDDHDCKFIAADKWERCEKLGRWP